VLRASAAEAATAEHPLAKGLGSAGTRFAPPACLAARPSVRGLVTVAASSPPPLAAGLSHVHRPAPMMASLIGPAGQQVRGFAGRKGGYKRKKKACRPRTVHQKGLGKRMEMYWPVHDAHRTRVPLYENSRRHVIWDHRMRKWMVMWYRSGIQVFRAFGARGIKFEQGRAKAILFYEQLKRAGKLGRPKPDQCRSGVRGVFFDKEERAWIARWTHCGLLKYAVFKTEELGFQQAYQDAVAHRVQSIRQYHEFVFQRTRWRGQRRPLGQGQT